MELINAMFIFIDELLGATSTLCSIN